LACIITALGFYYTNIKGKNEKVLKINNEAFDLIGGKSGSSYINIDQFTDVGDDNRIELALRKIEEGLKIIPDNIRGYWGRVLIY